MGKQKKTISVETNDPNQAVIKLILLADVEVELSPDPQTVYFRNLKKGEQSNQRVQLKNTSKNILHISSINANDKMIAVDLINHSPDWPIELKKDESLDLLVSFQYQIDKPRLSKQIKINYTGGEANEAFLRVYATLKEEPKEPETLTKPLPKDVSEKKNLKPMSVETSPSNEIFPLPPPPPNIQLKGDRNKPNDKLPEKGDSPCFNNRYSH